MDTYMVDAWLSFFFLALLFIFIPFFTTTQVNTPCGVCHWEPDYFLSHYIAIIPFPQRLVKRLGDLFFIIFY